MEIFKIPKKIKIINTENQIEINNVTVTGDKDIKLKVQRCNTINRKS